MNTTATRTQTLEIVATWTSTTTWAGQSIPTTETRYVHRGADMITEIPGHGTFRATDGDSFDLITTDRGGRIETRVHHVSQWGTRCVYDMGSYDLTNIETLVAFGY